MQPTATARRLRSRELGRGELVLRQYYLECLSQASYLVADSTTHQAAVIDPRRDIDDYLDDANRLGVHIGYVIESHVHADFVSGHLELAAATGATVVYGAHAAVGFVHRAVTDGDHLDLGHVSLEIRATPGHTPESICIVVQDWGAPYAALTGDTLFVGDVGRPDLLANAGLAPDTMARHLYRSIHSKLFTLPDPTLVLPGHGAGSACGKQLSSETVSTIGAQRHQNFALRLDDENAFVDTVTSSQKRPPRYFAYDTAINRRCHRLHTTRSPERITIASALEHRDNGAVVVDVRSADAFAACHLRGSINIGLDGRFAEWAATLIDPTARLVIIADNDDATAARTRLARVGLDEVVAWLPATDLASAPARERSAATRVDTNDLAARLRSPTPPTLLDVRTTTERRLGSIEPSLHLPLDELTDHCDELTGAKTVVVYCASGYRSTIAASLLRAGGAPNVTDLRGGFAAWVAGRNASSNQA